MAYGNWRFNATLKGGKYTQEQVTNSITYGNWRFNATRKGRKYKNNLLTPSLIEPGGSMPHS